MSELNANSVEPDQTPRSAGSDLDLHSLPTSHFWDARLKWVNYITYLYASCLGWFFILSSFNGSHLNSRFERERPPKNSS